MQKIILYYKFVPVKDPDMTMRWQRELCEKLNLKGRVIVSEHGINGTLGGKMDDLKAYKKAMNASKVFDDIEYKWSDGTRDDFPRLSVKVRDELVTLSPDKKFDVFDKGTPLRPKAWHEHLKKNPKATIIDARNDYESEIGKFKGAITPKIKTFRDIKPELDNLPRNKPIYTYCTGDIRCEYLSAYMKSEGFTDVYHLDGGVVKYGQEFKDDGLWEGKCYVFDQRKNIAFSDKAKDIATCVHCGRNTSNQVDCDNPQCSLQIVICPKCVKLKTHCVSHVRRSRTKV